MDTNLIFQFASASFLLALLPGPDNIFVLTESLSKGWKNGIAITTGLISGVLIHITLAATGISVLMYQSDVVFQLVKYFGAGYLFYLAYLSFKEVPIKLESNQTNTSFNFFKLMKTGFFMNVLNPKVSLFFIAFLPQFITRDGSSIIIQMMVLGVIFMIISFITFSSIAVLAGRLNSYLSSPIFWNITKWIKVIVMTGLGFFLLIG